MVILNKNLPVDLNRGFRYESNANAKIIEQALNELFRDSAYHRTNEKQAHNSGQITHNGWTVERELKYRAAQVRNLVIGANGDGIAETKDARVDLYAKSHATLSERLLSDFKRLTKRLDRVVHVDDFGAVSDGKTDSTQAFIDAMGSGNVQVNMSAGTYIVNEILMPNNTFLKGQGHAITKIKLHDDAPASAIVVTNKVMNGDAEGIAVEGVFLDWNKERQGGLLKPTGGSRSSTLRFAGVKGGYAKDVYTKGSGLHGIDVTYASDTYFYEGDGVRVPEHLESQYISIVDCDAEDFGDDGITTHHCRYVSIVNSGGRKPHGKGNSNGIEIDDGSRFVYLNDTYSELFFGGLEIKGHIDVSAASHIFVDHHRSYKDCRSFNFRHNGHHTATDVLSKTAINIVAVNLESIYPAENDVYKGNTSRALVISAFNNVTIKNMSGVGDENFTAGVPAIALQYLSKNISIDGINLTGFKNASADIKINGGNNKATGITLNNINIKDSAPVAIENGAGVYDTKVVGANLVGRGLGTAVKSYNNTMQLIAVMQTGYQYAAEIATRKYSVMPTVVKGGFSAATTGSAALHQTSFVLGATGSSYAHSARSGVMASGDNSHAYGSRSTVRNALRSETDQNSHTQDVFLSNRVKSRASYRNTAGYSDTGNASTANIKYELDTLRGNMRLAGTVTGSNDFADYGEYFESENGESIPNGTIVTLSGRFIRPADKGDKFLGVISGTAGIVLGENTFNHKNRFLTDEFGVTITEERTVEEVGIDDFGEEYLFQTIKVLPVKNPEYKEVLRESYVSRSERDEWNVVGLLGQIYVRVDESVSAGNSLSSNNGIASAADKGEWQVMEITTPFNKAKGYGVAMVLVK